MNNLINWQKLSVEKMSMLSLKDGKYIQGEDNFHYPFMICVGKDRHNMVRLYLIDCVMSDYVMFSLSTEEQAELKAFAIIQYLFQNGKVMDLINDKGVQST